MQSVPSKTVVHSQQGDPSMRRRKAYALARLPMDELDKDVEDIPRALDDRAAHLASAPGARGGGRRVGRELRGYQDIFSENLPRPASLGPSRPILRGAGVNLRGLILGSKHRVQQRADEVGEHSV